MKGVTTLLDGEQTHGFHLCEPNPKSITSKSSGFNCGEAVNFALGDWFQLGAVASWHYALLRRTPLLSFEELLCKEACQTSSNPDPKASPLTEDLSSQHCMKVFFVLLMRFQHRARWWLKKLRAQAFYFDIPELVFCSICQRDCYLAYINCNCIVGSICLCHETEIRSCPCGGHRKIFLRKNLAKLEALAQKFEQEDGILNEVQVRIQLGDGFLQTDLFACSEDDGYKSYDKIKFEVGTAICEQVQENLHSQSGFVSQKESGSLSSAGSTLSSLLKSDGHANCHEAKSIKMKCSQSVSVCSYPSAEITPSDKCRSSSSAQGSLVSLDNNDSDSEIFRVKRRSPIYMGKRKENDTFPTHQVLKRLKKLHSESLEDNAISAPRNSLITGRIAPITFKVRQHLLYPNLRKDDDSLPVKFREPSTKNNVSLSSVANVREATYLELGPKHLKVKGLSSSQRLPDNEDLNARRHYSFGSMI